MTEDRKEEARDGGATPPLRRADVSSLLLERPRRSMMAHLSRKVFALPVFLVSHFGRREPHLWLFGSFKGFRDSPRYIAEHIAQCEPDLTPIWVARTAQEADEARRAGLEVVMWRTPEADRAHRRAGVAFLCNAFRDLDFHRLGRAYVVHLYHGTPLKRVALDVDWRSFTARSRALNVLVRLNRMPMALQFRLVDLFVAPGELARRRYMTAFDASTRRVRALGSPRFDVIRGGAAYERVAGGDMRAKLGYRPDDRIVLWLPTWREQGDAGWLPRLEYPQVETALRGTEINLLVKTHPFADWAVYAERLSHHPRVRLLREDEVDVNCLLHVADELVTDYSSAAFDFAILQRPIHFFAPDVDDYAAGRDLYDRYEKVSGGMHHRAWSSLLAALAESSSDPSGSRGQLVARRVAAYAGNNTEPEVCRRVTEAVRQAVA